MGKLIKGLRENINGIIFFLLLLGIILLIIFNFFSLPSKETQFEIDSNNYSLSKTDTLKDKEIITHLVDNFDSYENKYSQVIDSELNKIKIDSNELILRKKLNNPLDLSKWDGNGVLYGWLDIEDSNDISSVQLILISKSGSRSFLIIENTLNSKNTLKIDDKDIPDYYLPKDEGLNKWEDFLLVNGANFLFWRGDNYTESGKFDIKDVEEYKLIVKTANLSEQNIIFRDLWVADGLQIEKNPTNGNWHNPNGMPMYGLFYPYPNHLKLVSVRQAQYISNGDHARIISNLKTPENFTMRVVFSIEDIEDKNSSKSLLNGFKLKDKENLENNYVRIAWDFDDVYDPGHDDSFVFISLQYNKFGLSRVYPIVRYFEQGQEPKLFNDSNRIEFKPEENKKYEIDITVIGQKTKATIYSINRGKLYKEGEVNYVFDKERPKEAYPIAIESTGKIKLNLYKIEVLNLREP